MPKAAAREAERIAAQLLAQRSVVYPDAVPVASIATESTAATQTAALADTETVLVDTLERVRPRSIGAEHVAYWAMLQLGFHDLLIECSLSGPLRAAILGVIIGRMAAPDSEAATHRWLGQHSGLGELPLLDVDFERIPTVTLYRASDALMKQRALIEFTLFDRAQSLFGFELTVTL